MKSGSRTGATGVLAVTLAAIGVLAIWPVARAGYPAIGDGLNHFYRLVEFEHLLAHGVWFPRWATDLGYGYGYPLFNYYPPLTYYLGALFHGLGLNEADSLLAVYAGAWLLAIGGAYRLARERGGPGAGLLAAAAYGLAPYLYFNTLARGALPETLGLGLLPWTLWAFYRLPGQPARAGLLLAALLYAALVLTHLLTALLALPLIVLFWVMAQCDQPTAATRSSQTAGRFNLLITNYPLLLALLLGLGLAAYFFIPAILETRAVQIGQLTTPGDLDYHHNFLELGTLLALPATYDGRLVSRAVPPSLSLAALALAALGLAWRAWPGRRGPRALAAWDGGLWLGLLGCSLLTLRVTQPLWGYLPGASLIQFPWRLVGPASLLLALLAARLLDDTPSTSETPAEPRPWRTRLLGLVPALALTGLSFYSLTWTFSAGAPAPAGAAVRDLAAYERDSGQLGTTSAGEFLPAGVAQLPDPRSLEGAYALHSIIARLGAPPAGVTVASQTATLTSAQAVLSAASAAQLTFDIFDFPGWRARVDGQPAPITASQPTGLITVSVPAGQHTVTVDFSPTPLRAAAAGLSFITAGLLALLASGRLPIPRTHPHASRHALTHAAFPTPPLAHTPTLFFAALLLVIRVTGIDGRDTPFSRSRFDGERVAGAGQALDANFDDQLVLIGLDLPGGSAAADALLPVTLFWRAQNVPRFDYASTLQALDDQGNLWGQSDSQNPGGLPTTRWALGQYARDTHLLRLRPGTPPGRYHLAAGAYQVGGAALSVLDANRAPLGQLEPLGEITVTRGQWPVAALGIAQPAHISLGPLTYLGGSLSSSRPQQGDVLSVELFWRADGPTRPDLGLRLELDNAQGQPIYLADGPPARADYPTQAWATGEIVRAVVRLPVAAGMPAGPASLRLSLTGAPSLPEPATIASLVVQAPQRSFRVPAMAHVLNAAMGPNARLLGYDQDGQGITLYWQSVAATDTSYSVFVHALDASGGISAQADALPLGGARPTTGWLPGEVLADRYNLALGDAASLEVGLYDPLTRQRLGTIRLP